MQPDELRERTAETREWLELAGEDLKAAERLLEGTPVLGPALFHAQQSAEKALKAYLTWRDQEFRRTHDLGELIDSCRTVDPTFVTIRGDALVLNPYAVETCYRQAHAGLTEAFATRGVGVARVVLDFVLAHLPPEVTN